MVALVCFRTPGNVPCFGIIFTNDNNQLLLRYIPMQSEIETLPNCQSLCSPCAVTRSVDPDEKQPKLSNVTQDSGNDMIFIHHSNAVTNECKIMLISTDCVMNGFIMYGITAATLSENSVQSFGLRLFFSHISWWRLRWMRPQMT